MRWEEVVRIASVAMIVTGFLLTIWNSRIARDILRCQRRTARSASGPRSLQRTYLLQGAFAAMAGLLGLMGYRFAAFAAVLLLTLASTRLLQHLPKEPRVRHPRSHSLLRPRRGRRGAIRSEPTTDGRRRDR